MTLRWLSHRRNPAPAGAGPTARLTSAAEWCLEQGWVPDPLVRAGIRRICARRLREEAAGSDTDREVGFAALVASMRRGPIASDPAAANRQHYEVPAAFYEQVLGPHLKYSCGFWPAGVDTLVGAERAMLDLTCERAKLADGQTLLDLGCGWGALALYAADRFPASRIVAVSNSRRQRAFIEAKAAELGLGNVAVWTAGIDDFVPPGRFDRIVSIEMFEHMRNYQELLRRLASWLTPDGRLFVHVFSHARYAYTYQSRGASDWMARHFFTGGLMPSHDLLLHFQDHVEVEARWHLDGTHYQRTAEAWLANLTSRRAAVRHVLALTYGAGAADRWWTRWRIFFMACAEMFGFRGGREWGISHYRLRPRAA